MYPCLQLSFIVDSIFILVKHLGVELLGHMIILGTSRLFSKEAVSCHICLPAIYKCPDFSISLPKLVFSVFLITVILMTMGMTPNGGEVFSISSCVFENDLLC